MLSKRGRSIIMMYFQNRFLSFYLQEESHCDIIARITSSFLSLSLPLSLLSEDVRKDHEEDFYYWYIVVEA
jgi:hypothetical protein